MYTMRKDLSHDRLLAENLSYYFAYGGRMDRVTRRFGLSEKRAAQIIREWSDRFPALQEALRNLGAQAERATVVMETSMKGACKHLKAALEGAPPC